MIDFMTASAKRYNEEPIVKYMDVVNETILPQGSWFGPKPGTDRWENPWLTMGLDENGFPKYIVKAFEISTKYLMKIRVTNHFLCITCGLLITCAPPKNPF